MNVSLLHFKDNEREENEIVIEDLSSLHSGMVAVQCYCGEVV